MFSSGVYYVKARLHTTQQCSICIFCMFGKVDSYFNIETLQEVNVLNHKTICITS